MKRNPIWSDASFFLLISRRMSSVGECSIYFIKSLVYFIRSDAAPILTTEANLIKSIWIYCAVVINILRDETKKILDLFLIRGRKKQSFF